MLNLNQLSNNPLYLVLLAFAAALSLFYLWRLWALSVRPRPEKETVALRRKQVTVLSALLGLLIVIPMIQGWISKNSSPSVVISPTISVTLSYDFVVAQAEGGKAPGYLTRGASADGDYLGKLIVEIAQVGQRAELQQLKPGVWVETAVPDIIPNNDRDANRLLEWWDQLPRVAGERLPINVDIVIEAKENGDGHPFFTHENWLCVPSAQAHADLLSNWAHTVTIPCVFTGSRVVKE